ncbi:hypothetical protein TWF481_002830 [Arthrobotrys musiformis]|uniref:Uncharacterized protein n=1 Tax=Arthrobotrys musiformis TaxID=47236 RepID=A0AAV9VTD2_9PEZI
MDQYTPFPHLKSTPSPMISTSNQHLKPDRTYYPEHRGELDSEGDNSPGEFAETNLSSDTGSSPMDDSDECHESINSADHLDDNAKKAITTMFDKITIIFACGNVESAKGFYENIVEFNAATFNDLNTWWKSRNGNDEFIKKAGILISFVHLFMWSEKGWNGQYALNEVEKRFMKTQKELPGKEEADYRLSMGGMEPGSWGKCI